MEREKMSTAVEAVNESEKYRFQSVEMRISNNEELNKKFDVILNAVMNDRGNVIFCRQEGDRFPGPQSIIAEFSGWKMYIEYDSNNQISKVDVSVRIPDQYYNGDKNLPVYTKDINDIEKTIELMKKDEEGNPDIENELMIAETMLKMQELVK